MITNDCHPSRRQFLKTTLLAGIGGSLAGPIAWTQQTTNNTPVRHGTSHTVPSHMRWLQSARVFLVDAYAYPFTPELEFDAQALAETMQDVKANVVRMATMGKYATIQIGRGSCRERV